MISVRGVARAAIMVAVAVLTVTGQVQAAPGKIVVANDEWTLGNSFAAPNDPGRFACNVARWFTGGQTGSFLAYSSNYGLTGSDLAAAMTEAGNAWTVSTIMAFDLATLQNYDGVFVGGYRADATVLAAYVNAGGNVYLMAGAGWLGDEPSNGPVEAAAWNPFLNQFGLGLSNYYNAISGNIPISSPHPIFDGVDSLYQSWGQSIFDLALEDPANQILVTSDGYGLYAAYAIPEPATLSLLALGGLVALRRRR